MFEHIKYFRLLKKVEPDIEIEKDFTSSEQYIILRIRGRKYYPCKRILKTRYLSLDQEIADYINSYAHDNGIQLKTIGY